MVTTRSQTLAKQQALGIFKAYIEPISAFSVMPIALFCLIHFLFNSPKGQANLTLIPEFFSKNYKGDLSKYTNDIISMAKPTIFGLVVVIGFSLFEFLNMSLVPGQKIKGQPSPSGFVPYYKKNGRLCHYFAMMCLVLLTIYLKTNWNFSPTIVIAQFPQVLSAANIVAFVLTLVFYLKAKLSPNSDIVKRDYFFYDFFHGIELFPRFFNVDLKWFLNCRIGMRCWKILVLLCLLLDYENTGSFRLSTSVTCGLQLLYMTKFFLYEEYFFNTMDNLFDHGGFYIIWGCYFFLPALYPLPSIYQALGHDSPQASPVLSIFSLFLGLFFLTTQRLAEADKNIARASKGEKGALGKPTFIRAQYRTEHDKATHESLLLTSGFWKVSRHYNYLAELGMALAWTLPTGFNSLIPYIYVMFLAILLVVRSIKDDERCRKKYFFFFIFLKYIPFFQFSFVQVWKLLG